MSSRHNNTENSTRLIAIQTERTDFKEGASVCLRGTQGIMRGIRADTSHSGFIAGVDEEEMNYSTSPHLLFYGEVRGSGASVT